MVNVTPIIQIETHDVLPMNNPNRNLYCSNMLGIMAWRNLYQNNGVEQQARNNGEENPYHNLLSSSDQQPNIEFILKPRSEQWRGTQSEEQQ